MSAPLAGLVEIDYRGERYVLGRGAGVYAIWDLHAGGGPIRTFALTEEGWREAWLEFRELEGPGTSDLPRVSGSPGSLQPLRAGQIAGRSVVLWWRNLGALIAISTLLVIPVEAILTTLTVLNLRRVPVSIGARSLLLYEPEPWVQVTDAVVRFLVLSPLLTAAVLTAAATIILGRRASVRVSYRVALRKALSVLWVVILMTLVFVAAIVPGVAVALVLGLAVDPNAGGGSANTVLAIVMLLILSLPPAIFVVLRLLYAPAVVVFEDLRGVAALRRSWSLVRGMTWKVLGTTLLVALIVGAFGIPLGIVIAILFSSGLSPEALFILGSVFGVFVGILSLPISSQSTVLLYIDSRVRREGYRGADLERELSEAGA